MKNMVVHKYIQTLENKYGDKLISKLDLNYLIQLWDIFDNFDLDQLQSRDAGVGGGADFVHHITIGLSRFLDEAMRLHKSLAIMFIDK